MVSKSVSLGFELTRTCLEKTGSSGGAIMRED